MPKTKRDGAEEPTINNPYTIHKSDYLLTETTVWFIIMLIFRLS